MFFFVYRDRSQISKHPSRTRSCWAMPPTKNFKSFLLLFSSKLRNIFVYMLDHPPFFETSTGITLIIKKVNIESVLYSLLNNSVLNNF